MTPYEDMDEELRRILDEGSASAQPAELAEFRASIPPEPMGSELPRGTKVVFADYQPEAVTPPPSRVPIQPKVLDVSNEPMDDFELAAAKAEDRQARAREAMERGTRQLIGGLTRTEALPSTPGPTDAVEKLLARRRERDARERQLRQDALRGQEAANNAARTAAYLKTTEAAGPRAERGLDLKEKELALREDMATKKAEETQAQFEERKRHNRATEGIGWTSAKRADDKAERDEERLRLKTDALKPRQGWEPIEEGAPTFRDAGQAKAFDTSVSAMGAIRNHRDHVLHELEALRKAKTPGEADIIVGRLNAQMGALASKLRDAEGLNNTDAANHAIETMLSLQNGSAVNWKNVVNQGRLPAILDAAINSGEANLDTIAQSNNLRRAKAAPVKMKFPDGSVHDVPPEKMELARRKGAVPNG